MSCKNLLTSRFCLLVVPGLAVRWWLSWIGDGDEDEDQAKQVSINPAHDRMH